MGRRESAGVPERVHRDGRRTGGEFPMAAGLRSLNVATAAAMMLGEALTTDEHKSANQLPSGRLGARLEREGDGSPHLSWSREDSANARTLGLAAI